MSESPSFPNTVPPWTSPGDATRLILQGYTFRTGIRVAAVVGTILSLANQGGLMLSGRVSMAAVVPVGVNYLVPFVVSSVGYLAPFRVSATSQELVGGESVTS